jgi:predicted transcriptional regulator
MSRAARHPESIDERTMCQLAALADGSLPVRLQAELRRRVAASPSLAEALEKQRLAVAALRSVRVPAPPDLRRRVEELARRT